MKAQAYWVTTYQLQVVSPWAYSSTLRPAFLCHIQFFPPHKIVTMETLISRLQKPVDDIIVATSTFNLSTKDGHTLILWK